jgi:hypothetical protein
MRLYIDDDSVDPGLIRLLRRDGHDVQIPADAGLMGSSDQVHFAHAIREQRVLRVESLAVRQPVPCEREGQFTLRRGAFSGSMNRTTAAKG